MQRGAALMLLLLAGLQCAAGGSALGRDEKRAERITADDDPVLLPLTAVPRALHPGALNAVFDPDTTGSVSKPTQRSRPPCTALAWFPDVLPSSSTGACPDATRENRERNASALSPPIRWCVPCDGGLGTRGEPRPTKPAFAGKISTLYLRRHIW